MPELEENPSASKPPRQEGLNPSWRGGFLSRAAAEASASKPPRREGPPPYKGGALVQGVQRPISLEYQIKPPSYNI